MRLACSNNTFPESRRLQNTRRRTGISLTPAAFPLRKLYGKGLADLNIIFAHPPALFRHFHRIERHRYHIRLSIQSAVLQNLLILHMTGILILYPHIKLCLITA